MSLVEDSSRENDQEEPEICLQEDGEVNDSDATQNQKEKDEKMKDLVNSSQRDKRSISPLSLNFSQFKEEVLKVFTKTEHENQAETKPVSSKLDLLKEEFSQFKEDVTSVFTGSSSKDKETKSADPKTSQSAEKTLDRLKEDFSHFKDDLSNVFRLGLSKERDNKRTSAKEDASNASKIKVLKAERTDPFSLFRRDQKPLQTSETAENSTGTDQEQRDDGFSGNFSETNEEEINNSRKDGMNEVEDGELGITVSEETASLSETQQSEEMIPSSQAAEQSRRSDEWSDDSSVVSAEEETMNEEDEEDTTNEEDEEDTMNEEDEEDTMNEEDEEETINEEDEEDTMNEEDEEDTMNEEDEEDTMNEEDEEETINEEDEEETMNEEDEEETSSETLTRESPSSGISLFSPRDPNKDDTRDQPGGDLWMVKNFACYLTFDPNTANSELRLTDCNRKATRVWPDLRLSSTLDRFEHCPQVLCREGLLDSVYWEVEWCGGADIGITHNSISRDGDPARCLLGHNEWSWSLECSEGSYTPCHNNKRFRSSSPRPFTHRVGVYLDWSAGSLSFYCISPDTMVHLHTFTATFTERLYPGFWVWAYDGSVSLCQVELDWERLLQ